jgi:hypothetical protein
MISFKNNRGNTLVIVIISVVVLAAIAGGTYFYIRYQNNKKIIDQYNAYADKRNEFRDILEEIPATIQNQSDLDKLKGISKRADNKWDEVKTSELPDFISKEMKECHERGSKIIEGMEFTVTIIEKASKGQTITQADDDKAKELKEYIPTQTNLDKTGEICDEADKKVESELNKLGIVLKDAEDKK